MKVLLAAVAVNAIVSDEGQTSLINLVEEVFIPPPVDPLGSDATLLGPLCFVVILEATNEKEAKGGSIPSELWIGTPSGKKIGEQTVQVDFDGLKKCRAEFRYKGMPFIGFGTYSYNLTCSDVTASWSLDVISTATPDLLGGTTETAA